MIKRFLSRLILPPTALMVLLPLVLIVPNVVLAFTEQWTPLAKLAGVALPMGLYCLLAACSRRIGRTALWCLPLMVYCAFQIVLIFLYGESIIAIDMFTNVLTTNPGEAGELLGNLLGAIACVCVLYLPVLVEGGVLTYKKAEVPAPARRGMRKAGWTLVAIGAVLTGACYVWVPQYKVERQMFPVNVIYNSVVSLTRAGSSAEYPATSAAFSYHAQSTRPDSVPEVYVLVVGETGRAGNWQLLGYDRPTTPRLAARGDVLPFTKAVTESNTTHKCVPMILSWLDADTFGDSIGSSKSVISAFSDAGFATAFFSNQQRNHSYTEFFAAEADTTVYISDLPEAQLDGELLPLARGFIDAHPAEKVLVVLHTYGGHFNYRERYPRSEARFMPDTPVEAAAKNRPSLVNAYDNSILYADLVLSSVIAHLDSIDRPAGMLYLADHGEDIFDDSRHRFLHASPTPTYTQLHVPMVIWLSSEHALMSPGMREQAAAHRDVQVASSRSAFHTLLDMAGISTPYFIPSQSLVNAAYSPVAPRYVNDYNEGVALDDSGLRDLDRQAFTAHALKYK